MEKPRFLLVSELVNDFKNNIDEVKKVINHLNDENYKMSYIYCYALLEGALNQFAKTVCYAFPEKVINNDAANGLKVNKLIEFIKSENGIEELVEFRIRKKSKNDLLEIINEYSKITGLKIEKLPSYDRDILISISRERNNLVHAHTLANTDCYHPRAKYEYIKKDKVENYLKFLEKLMVEILQEIEKIYGDYTFKKLFESSVEYTLSACLGHKFYKIKDGKYTLDLNNCEYLSKALSSGEQYVLGWWMYLYSDSIGTKYGINILKKASYLDEGTLEKIKFIQEFGRRFPFVLDGQKADY